MTDATFAVDSSVKTAAGCTSISVPNWSTPLEPFPQLCQLGMNCKMRDVLPNSLQYLQVVIHCDLTTASAIKYERTVIYLYTKIKYK